MAATARQFLHFHSRRQAVHNCRFRLFKIRPLQDGLRGSFVFAFRRGVRSPMPWRKHHSVLDFLTSSAFLGSNRRPTTNNVQKLVTQGAQIPAEPTFLSTILLRCRPIGRRGCWLPMLSDPANRSNRLLLRLSWPLGLTGAILSCSYRLSFANCYRNRLSFRKRSYPS